MTVVISEIKGPFVYPDEPGVFQFLPDSDNVLSLSDLFGKMDQEDFKVGMTELNGWLERAGIEGDSVAGNMVMGEGTIGFYHFAEPEELVNYSVPGTDFHYEGPVMVFKLYLWDERPPEWLFEYLPMEIW